MTYVVEGRKALNDAAADKNTVAIIDGDGDIDHGGQLSIQIWRQLEGPLPLVGITVKKPEIFEKKVI